MFHLNAVERCCVTLQNQSSSSIICIEKNDTLEVYTIIEGNLMLYYKLFDTLHLVYFDECNGRIKIIRKNLRTNY